MLSICAVLASVQGVINVEYRLLVFQSDQSGCSSQLDFVITKTHSEEPRSSPRLVRSVPSASIV